MVSATVVDTYGVLTLLVIVCAFLLGILNVQVVHYFGRFPRDPLWLKQIVLCTLGLEVFQQICATILSYYYLISHFGENDFIGISRWPITLTIISETLVCLLAQSYFIRRSWLLGRKKPVLPALMSILAFIQLFCGVWSTVISVTSKRITDYIQWQPVEIVWYSSTIVMDIAISFYIVTSIRGTRTGFKALDSRMRLLVVYTIVTAIITTCLSIAVVTSFNTLNPTLWWLGLSFVLSRVYSNLLLAALNLRGKWTDAEVVCDETFELHETRPNQPQTRVTAITESFARDPQNFDSTVIIIE